MRADPVRRRSIDRSDLLRAAVELVDEDGLEALSVRQLAVRLGVDPMTIYRHVASKEDLLDALTGTVYAELSLTRTEGHPREQIHRLAADFRQVVLRHPNLLPLLVTRPLSVALARRPRSALVITEELFRLLSDAGLEENERVRCYRRIVSWMLGWALTELRVIADNPEDDEPAVRFGFQHLPRQEFGELRRAAAMLEDTSSDQEYHDGLDQLLRDFGI